MFRKSSLPVVQPMTRVKILWRWAFVLGIVILGLLACLQLKIKNDAVDLLPGDSVRGDIRQLQRMGLVDRLFITLSLSDEIADEALAKKNLQQSAAKLGERLTKSGHFSYVLAHLPAGYEFALFARLHASLPMLLDDKDLQKIAGKTSPEGMRTGLEKSFALLNSPTGIALKKQVQIDPLGLVTLGLDKLNYLRSEHSMRIDDGYFMSRDGRSCLLVAESRDSLTNSQTALTVQAFLDAAYPETLAPGVQARVIGSLPHTLANSQSIQNDLRQLLPAATILLFLLLAITLRDIRALVVFSVPYLAAPPAIAVARLVYGDLSSMALGFGIVLLGIAIDFPIHLYLTLTRGRGSRQELLKELGRPLVFAALTTMAGFIILLFSQVAAHRQMGLMAFVGVGIALVFSWLLVPTIIKKQSPEQPRSGRKWLLPRLVSLQPGWILALWLLVLLPGILVWPQLRYNGDLRALDAPDQQVLDDERHFTATWGQRGEQAFIIAEGTSLAEVLDGNARVASFLQDKKIKNYQTFAPLLPGPGTQDANRQGWKSFWSGLRPNFDKQFIGEAVSLGFTEQAFAPFFKWLDTEPEALAPDTFLGGPLQPLFASMLKTPSSPGGYKGDDKYLAMTTVAIDSAVLEELLQFAAGEPQVMVLAALKWRAEVERLLSHDIFSLSLAAGLAIIILLAIQFGNMRSVAAALAPVLSALAAMSLFCFLTGAQLTMMHLIMGIMVIGLAVDYGIFVVCEKLGDRGEASVKAVSICAMSTIIGFGVLAFAGHPALHALGVTVLVGIGVSWPVAVLVSPAFLALGRKE